MSPRDPKYLKNREQGIVIWVCQAKIGPGQTWSGGPVLPHPSICMYLRTLRNLSFQKFSTPDVLQYSYLTCQVICTIGLPTDIF